MLAPRSRLPFSLFGAAAMLILAEGAARHLVQPDQAPRLLVERKPNVVILEHDVRPQGERRSLLLVGNSHTYALPGLHPGAGLRADPGATLIDELSRLGAGARDLPNFYRLSEPNFGPLEMLVSVAQLIHEGYRPTIVVVGVTYRNMARGSELRHSVLDAFKDDGFAGWLRSELEAHPGDGSQWLLASIQSARDQVKRELDLERTRSHADAADIVLTDFVGRRLTLVGQNTDIRAILYRQFNYGLARVLWRGGGGVTNAVIHDDLVVNRAALHALIALLDRYGARVLCYQAPERTDVAPMIDTSGQPAEMLSLQSYLARFGFRLLDARNVVPNEYWGWERDTPDRSHFTEPGHRALAKFLIEQGDLDRVLSETSR